MNNNNDHSHKFAEDNSNKILNAIIAVALILLLLFIVNLFKNDTTDTPRVNSPETSSSSLPEVNAQNYVQKEGLLAYQDLKSKGYSVTASFENDMLTEMNGNAGELFNGLDYGDKDDRLSVDAFVVESVIQDGENIKLIIAHEPKSD